MLRNIFRNRRNSAPSLVVACLLVPLAPHLRAETPKIGPLPGTINEASSEPIANTIVAATSVDTDQAQIPATGAVNTYDFSQLPLGNYRARVKDAGFKTVGIPSAAGLTAAMLGRNPDVDWQTNDNRPATPQDNTAPSSANPTAPSLQDLGLSPDQTQGNAEAQARLDKRTHMLKIHQRFGLITTIPLIATLVSSAGAAGKSTSTTSRDLHTALGGVTADLYFTTAYFAIRAPRIPGTESRGPIRLHKALAWIHGPGMIMTPILGAMAFDQKSKGEKVHGIASAHGPVAVVTGLAYAAALLSVSVKF